MTRQRSCENIETLAVAGHDGKRLDRSAPLDPERAARLAAEIETAVGNDHDERLRVAMLHVDDFSQREIAELVGKNPSSVCRQISTTMNMLRVLLLIPVIEEWLDQCGACILSLQRCRSLAFDLDAFFVHLPNSRVSLRKRPNWEKLYRLIKRERRLLNQAADLNAVNCVPHVAVWNDEKIDRWSVDFPLLFLDRDRAAAFACENAVNAIYHIASGRIEKP